MPGLGVVVRLALGDDRDALDEIEFGHFELFALMQVDRAGVDVVEGA